MPQSVNKPVSAFFAEKLWSGVKQAVSDVNIDYDTPDGQMVAHLQKNVYQFAAAKNWQQMKDITRALVDENGKLREFAAFKAAAMEITGDHMQWLKTEYNTAVSGGQMASKWVDIQRDKDILPYLEYDAVLDGRTTELCSKFHGIILPVDDPFWKAYYPPNHFNCRSTVRQVRSGALTDKSTIEYPDIPPMFQTNLGENQLIFPAGSAYFKGAPAQVLEDAIKMLPQGEGWLTPQKFENGGRVRIHKAVDIKAKDFADTLEVASLKAKGGDKVDLLPNLPNNDPLVKHLFKGAKLNKRPDFKINDAFVELETSTNSRNINNLKHAIGQGSKQANIVIVKLNSRLDSNMMNRVAKGRFKDHKTLQRIEFYYNGEVIGVYQRF